MALPTEAMLLSLCRRIDPYAVVERMIAGIDIDAHPEWRDSAIQTLEDLDGEDIFDRYFFIAAKLPDDGLKRQLAAAGSSAASGLFSAFGMIASPPSAGDLDRRRRQASKLRESLATGLTLRPVTPADIRWVYARAAYRGLMEPALDENWDPEITEVGDGPDAELRGPSLVNLADAVFQEGGDRKIDENRPRHSRYVRVETEFGVSYQTFMVMAGMPRQWRFPNGGGEWFVAADQAPFPVDWCARITSIPNQEAQLKSRRQARQLRAQVDEYEGETSGPPANLMDAMDAVDAQRSELAASPSTPEQRVTMIFALGSWSLDDLEEQAAQMRTMYEAWEYEMPRPTGNQSQLFRAMLPGSASPAVARDYAQYLLPSALASGMPVGGTRVGDPTGMHFGTSLDGGTNQPVLLDAAYGSSINTNGSLGICGVPGVGKSYGLKEITDATLARGGRVVALDRTAFGEYVKSAEAAPGTKQVARLAADSDTSIDPVRMFADMADRIRYSTGFLTLLTGTSPTDNDGATLARAVRAVCARNGSLVDVIAELDEMSAARPAAGDLARKIENFAETDMADLVFGTQDVLTLDADYIVLWCPGLRLPSRSQLNNPNLAKQMLPEQVLSQALLYLIAAIGRDVILSDVTRFAAMKIDEGYALTNSPQGHDLLLELVRDGRKHNAALWFSSQHPNDLGDDEMRDQLGMRMVYRQKEGGAPAALKFLGMEATPEWIDVVENLETGECLFRDVRDRIGRVKVASASGDRHAAFNTNPSERESGIDDDDFRSGSTAQQLLVEGAPT